MRQGPQTDGWMGSAAKRDDPKCQAFGFVFGRDFPADKDATGNKKVVNCAFGRGQMDKPDGQPGSRAYTVMASNVGGKLGPGQSFWVRYYLMVGTMEDVVRNAREYKKKVDYNALNLAEEQATVQPLYRKTLNDGTVTLTREGSKGAEPVCRVYNEPVLNSKPLFVIRELSDGRSIVTTDPYGLSRRKPYRNPLPKDHKLHGKLENTVKYYTHESEAGKRLQWELLGFVMPDKNAKLEESKYLPISDIVSVPASSENILVRRLK